MGAQTADPTGRTTTRRAREDESPVHEVELSPYFLSKYEIRRPWLRFVTAIRASTDRRPTSGGHPTDLTIPSRP